MSLNAMTSHWCDQHVLCYPMPGKSLDKCMELREMGMTKDSAKVQRKMLLKLKKQEQKLERGYHKAAKSESVFDFLNGQIFSTKRKYGHVNCLLTLAAW